MNTKELVPVLENSKIFMGELSQFIGKQFIIEHKDGNITGTLSHFKGHYAIGHDHTYVSGYGYNASVEFDSVSVNLVIPLSGSIYLEPTLPNLPECVHKIYNQVLTEYLRSQE